MADNNKVTIDAAWFNHLFTRSVERERLWSDREGLILECEKIAKERDELKAKVNAYEPKIKELDTATLDQERMNKCDEVTAKRLAAAERCIEDCFNLCNKKWNATAEIANIIRAYREKEAK